MKNANLKTTAATYAILALAGGVGFYLPEDLGVVVIESQPAAAEITPATSHASPSLDLIGHHDHDALPCHPMVALTAAFLAEQTH